MKGIIKFRFRRQVPDRSSSRCAAFFTLQRVISKRLSYLRAAATGQPLLIDAVSHHSDRVPKAAAPVAAASRRVC